MPTSRSPIALPAHPIAAGTHESREAWPAPRVEVPQEPTRRSDPSIKVKVNPRVATDPYTSTGQGAFDEEHHTIQQLMIEVVEAVNRNSRAEVGTALDAVLSTTTAHFRHEERQMAATAYPKRVGHKEAHDAFLADLQRFRVLLARQGITTDFRKWVLGRMSHWFRFHVVAADVEFGKYLSAWEAASVPSRQP